MITETKTQAQIHEQWTRINKLLNTNSRNLMRVAHPETDGNRMLVNNWGNKEARVIYDRENERERKIYEIYTFAINRAFVREYPNHVLAMSK